MKLPHSRFCILPWVSLEVLPIGTFRPCSVADEEITDEHGEPFNLHEDSFDTARHSLYMMDLRRQFLNGEQPKTCRKCWRNEDAGRRSKRMDRLNQLKHIVTDEEWHQNPKPLVFLYLKLGNICNLKCRICSSYNSSTFAAEELKRVINKKASWHYEVNQKGQWPRRAEKFWRKLSSLSGSLRYIEFTGGEPFLIREHFEYLEELIEKGYAPKIEIHYNTNGTIWPGRYVHLWEHFKHVEIVFSIDDIGARFEYERTNASWPEVMNNIMKFIVLRTESDNIRLKLCCTINVLNVLYLESVANWHIFDKDDFFVYWAMLHDAPENCIQALYKETKDAIRDKLLLADVDDATLEKFKRVVDFMYEDNGETEHAVKARIIELDERRGHSLRSTHPELYKLLFNGN